MCGIVAVFSRREPVSPAVLQQATASLYHRGPDGRRQWISPDQRVGLGHTRLSIIDLSTGDQPIASEDCCTHVIVNGEFYDYERTQRELKSRGHHLRTRSDSEIALHLYEEFVRAEAGPPHPSTTRQRCLLDLSIVGNASWLPPRDSNPD